MAVYGKSLGAALGQFALDGDSDQARMKGMLDGARTGAYEANAKQSLAQALKAQAETSQIQAENDSRTPERILGNAMTGFGIPQDDVQAVGQFLKTGQLGGKYAPAMDGMGPSAPAPSWAGKLPDLGRSIQGVNTALAIGDKNSNNIAQADATYANTDMVKRVAGGGNQQDTIRALLAAKGKAEFDNLGGNGVFSGIDGRQDLNAVGTSAAQENRAQAGAAGAAAGASNARAQQIRQETAQGGKSGQTQIITDAAGNVTLVDKVTGQARPALYADGKAVGAKLPPGRGDKPLTEGQAKAVAFASRMENSAQIIDDLAKKGVLASTPGSRAGFGIGAVISGLQPEGRQQLDQAKRDFINAVLRRESGAVITDQEFDNAEKQYFPQIGEKSGNVQQKAKNRRIALEGMKADIPASSGDVTGDIIRKAGGAAPANIDALLNKYK